MSIIWLRQQARVLSRYVRSDDTGGDDDEDDEAEDDDEEHDEDEGDAVKPSASR